MAHLEKVPALLYQSYTDEGSSIETTPHSALQAQSSRI